MEHTEIKVDPRLQRGTSSDPKGDALRRKIVNCGTEDEKRPTYTVTTTVLKVDEHFNITVLKNGEEIAQSLGWFVHFEGSWESLYFGDVKPNFDKGDAVKITFERLEKEAR